MFVIDGRYIQDHFPGIGRYTFNLIDALARIAPDEKFSVLFNPALKNTRYDLNALVRYPNVHLHRVDALTFSLREQWHLPGVIGGLRADVFHSPYYLKPYLTRGSSVVTLFDLIPTLFPPEVPNVAARLAFRYLAALAIRTSTRVIVPSEATRQDVVRLLHAPPEKIAVTPLAASADFKPVPETEIARVREKYALPKPYALYVGTNKPHKNLSVLFDAWARVEADAMLVIAGAWDVRYAGGRGSRGAGERGREGERETERRWHADTLAR
jgi:alpha-1,3-rhamnosyl/mannosyltransferase